MASGLQCPGCGHVHPAGLPEIARGDATFRCYGCYRTLSIPEGWTGRPSPRPPSPELTDDAPPGAGTRDARDARLAGRGRARTGALTAPTAGTSSVDSPTQMVPSVTSTGSPTGAAPAPAPPGRTTTSPVWAAPRRTAPPLPAAIRAAVWAGSFTLGLLIAAFVLRKVGVLDVDAVIDLYAGAGPGRFGILVLLLPLWAVGSATIAHFSLEALAKRRARGLRTG